MSGFLPVHCPDVLFEKPFQKGIKKLVPAPVSYCPEASADFVRGSGAGIKETDVVLNEDIVYIKEKVDDIWEQTKEILTVLSDILCID